jgi:serine/threonine-protein kinase
MSRTTPFHKPIPGSVTLPKALYGYEVVDFIGEGAGSMIYVVSHAESKQLYALKHVVRKNDKAIRFVEQLENEYAVGSKLTHPHIRRPVECRVNKSLFFKVTDAILVMELFDGMPLDMNLPGPLPHMIECFMDVAKALDYMHTTGWVHCDLKPSNILINKDRSLKIIDLGQACAIGTIKKRIQGTPDFIAPEQVKCLAVTPRTDVFNFGATMYWCLTSRKLPTLFSIRKSDHGFILDEQLATPRAINPGIPESVSTLVMDCVKTNPARRPEMPEVIRRLEIIHHVLTRDLPPSATQ